MPTDIHLTSGETVHTDEELTAVQAKLTGDLWAVIENQSGEKVAIRTDQVTHLLGHKAYETHGF